MTFNLSAMSSFPSELPSRPLSFTSSPEPQEEQQNQQQPPPPQQQQQQQQHDLSHEFMVRQACVLSAEGASRTLTQVFKSTHSNIFASIKYFEYLRL